MQNNKSLVNLGVQSVDVIKQMQKFVVVHLQQHTSNLASQISMRTIRQDISYSKMKEI